MGGKGTFGPGTARNPTGVGESDGVSAVERVSGRNFRTFRLFSFEVPRRDLHYPLATMRRLDAMGQLKEQLIKHIDEAHSMEQNVLRVLDGMIATTDDPEILDALEHHKMQTQGHADRMAQRLEAH